MADYRLLGLNEFVHDQREAHLPVEHVLCLADNESLLLLLLFLLGPYLQLSLEGLGESDCCCGDLLRLLLLGLLGLLLGFFTLLGVLRLCRLLSCSLVTTFVPSFDGELVAVFLELGEQVGTLLVLEGGLFSQLPLECLRLDIQHGLLVLRRLGRVLHELVHGQHVLHQQLLTALAHVREEPRVARE